MVVSKDKVNMDRKEKSTEELINTYFGYLIKEKGFTYDGKFFDSDKLRLFINAGRRHLDISIWLKSKPKFTETSFSWFMRSKNIDMKLHGDLEENFSILSKHFYQHLDELNSDREDWFLPTLQCRFETVMRDSNKKLEERLNIESERQLYEYIKAIDSIWNP